MFLDWINTIVIPWWAYLIFGLLIAALAIWNYLKYGFWGAVRGTLVGVSIWILTPPYVADVESLMALLIIPLLISMGVGLIWATILAFSLIYIIAAIILIMHFFVLP